jgi:EmrB/QacA subfamily drug resistance transporter
VTTVRGKRTATGAPVVALVCVAIFMTTLDASIVNIGLPSIALAFRTPLTGTLEWIVIGYLVVIGALLLTFGRLSDMIGRSPIWITGLIVFTAGSALCGAAPSLALLIAARALQGVGGALILSTSVAILSNAVPENHRGHALGWGALSIALGASAGPTIGGFLTTLGTWRWIFYVNVPIGLVAILASLWLIPPTFQRTTQKFDLQGALLLAIALAALTLGLSFGQEWGWTSAPVIAILAIGVASLAAGVAVEARSTHPIIDLQLFRNRVFSSAVASLLCSMLALFAIGFLFPFYFEGLRGFAPERTGLLLTPFPLAMAIVAPGAGALSDRIGSRLLAPLALAITTAALLLLTQLDATSPMSEIWWRLALAGAGLGLFQSPNTRSLMSAAPAAQQGMASGVFATARITGQALSVALAGAVFATLGGAAAGSALAAVPAGDAARAALETEFLHAFHAAIATCAGFAALGALAALVRGRESQAQVRESAAPVLSRNMRAVAVVMCVALGVAREAEAQSGVMIEPRPPISAPADSASYPRLTLREAVERALAVSPIVASGVGGVEIARSYKRTTVGAYLPTVVATSAATRANASQTATSTGVGGGVASPTSSQTYGLAAAVDVFTGGRRKAYQDLARADLRAAGSTLVSDRFVVMLSAQLGFYEVIRATDLVQVARAGLAEADQLLRFTTSMFRAGTVTRSDLLRAQLQSTTMQEQLLAATDTLVAASYALGWIVGVDGAVGVRPDSTSESIRPLALDDSTIVRLAVETSPSVAVAEDIAAATKAGLRAARTQYIPTVSASGGRNWANSSTVVTGAARPGWTVTVGTSFPLFNGFLREDAVERAEVAAYVARVTVGDTRRSARATAAQLLAALNTTTASIVLGTEAIRSAREDLRVQTARYRAGISTILDVLTSEAALIQAEYSLARSQHRYHTTRAALEALVGRTL